MPIFTQPCPAPEATGVYTRSRLCQTAQFGGIQTCPVNSDEYEVADCQDIGKPGKGITYNACSCLQYVPIIIIRIYGMQCKRFNKVSFQLMKIYILTCDK